MGSPALVGGAALAVMLVSGLGLLVRRMFDNKPVKASATVTIGRPPELVVTAVLQALLDIRGARLEGLTPYRSVIVVHRAPTWAILPALWLFPLGGLFFLVHREVRLQVSLFACPTGTVVRLTGPSEQALLRRAHAAVLALPTAREGLDRTPMLRV